MDGRLPFHRPILLSPMWHFNDVYPKPLSRGRNPEEPRTGGTQPDLPRGHGTRVYILLPVIQTLAQMGGRQPPLELRPLPGFLLIRRVLWNPHQCVSRSVMSDSL